MALNMARAGARSRPSVIPRLTMFEIHGREITSEDKRSLTTANLSSRAKRSDIVALATLSCGQANDPDPSLAMTRLRLHQRRERQLQKRGTRGGDAETASNCRFPNA